MCHAACRILVLGPRIEPVPPTLEACVHAQSLSCVQFFAAPWTVACQAPLSTNFSGKNTGNRLPFPTPGTLLDLGIKPVSLVSPALAVGFSTTKPLGKPYSGNTKS